MCRLRSLASMRAVVCRTAAGSTRSSCAIRRATLIRNWPGSSAMMRAASSGRMCARRTATVCGCCSARMATTCRGSAWASTASGPVVFLFSSSSSTSSARACPSRSWRNWRASVMPPWFTRVDSWILPTSSPKISSTVSVPSAGRLATSVVKAMASGSDISFKMGFAFLGPSWAKTTATFWRFVRRTEGATRSGAGAATVAGVDGSASRSVPGVLDAVVVIPGAPFRRRLRARPPSS